MSRQNTTESLLCHQDTYFQEGRAASEAIFDNDTAKPSAFIDFLSPDCHQQVEVSLVNEVQPTNKPVDHKVYVNYPYSFRNTKLDLLPHQRAAPVRDASVYFVDNSGYQGYEVQAGTHNHNVEGPMRNNTPFMPPPPPAESTYEVLVNTNGLSMEDANDHLIYLANTYIQKIQESKFYFTHELSSGNLLSNEDPCPSDLSVFQYVTEWCAAATLWWDRNFSQMQKPVHVHHVRPQHRRGESAEFKADLPTPTKRRTPIFDPPRPRSQQQAMPSFKKSK